MTAKRQRKCCATEAGGGPHAPNCLNNPGNIGVHTVATTPAGQRTLPPDNADAEPDWSRKCHVCKQPPAIPATGLCAACTFGEAGALEDFR